MRDSIAETGTISGVPQCSLHRTGRNWTAQGAREEETFGRSRAAPIVALGKSPNATPAAEIGPHSWFAYLDTDGVDKLHADFVANGAVILQSPINRPYGMREFVVATPDGHRIVFGQDIAKR